MCARIIAVRDRPSRQQAARTAASTRQQRRRAAGCAARCSAARRSQRPAQRRRRGRSASARCTRRGSCGSVAAQNGASCAQRCARRPRQPTCSRIQRSRNGLAVCHRSRSGSSSRPRPSMLSSVFCSSTSCGWTSTLKRREVWNRRSSSRPKEISFSGRSKIGSHTARIAASNSSTRVPARHPARVEVRLRDAPVVAVEEGEEVLRQVVLVDLGERAHDAEVERDVAAVVGDQDVARVHVGVEEAVAEHLGEEDLHAGARERRNVDALLAQASAPARSACRACAPSPSRAARTSPSAPPAPAAAASRRNCAAAGSRWPPRASGRARRRGGARTRPPPRAASGAGRRPTALDQAGGGVEQREVARDRPLDAGAQHLDRDLGAVVQRARGAPARPRRSRPACCSKDSKQLVERLRPSERSISATASSDGNGGTRSCSFASSSAMSSGSRSRRVDSTWPNLTKIGPRVSSASRRRWPRGRACEPRGAKGTRAARSAGRRRGCARAAAAYARRSIRLSSRASASRRRADGSAKRFELARAARAARFSSVA